MSKPSLAIKSAKVTMVPGAKPRDMLAVVEVESGDPLGFYSFHEEDGWVWHSFDSCYDHSI